MPAPIVIALGSLVAGSITYLFLTKKNSKRSNSSTKTEASNKEDTTNHRQQTESDNPDFMPIDEGPSVLEKALKAAAVIIIAAGAAGVASSILNKSSNSTARRSRSENLDIEVDDLGEDYCDDFMHSEVSNVFNDCCGTMPNYNPETYSMPDNPSDAELDFIYESEQAAAVQEGNTKA